jgi:hypothetical protein
MDFLPLRVQNIFNSMFQPDPVQLNPAEMAATGNIPGPVPQQQGINPEVLAALAPSTQAQQQLMGHLQNQPKREDYKPSMFGRITSALSGLSAAGPQAYSGGAALGYRGMGAEGAKIIDANMNRGYNRAMADWSAKADPLGTLASSERADNTNKRLSAQMLLTDADRDAERKRKETEDKARNDREAAKLEEKYAHLAYLREKSLNPAGKIIADKDGFVLIVNPVTGEVKPLFDDDGNKIKSDKLPDEMKLEIQQNNALAQIAARGGESRATARVTGDESRKTAEVRGEEQRKTVATQGAKEVEVSKQTLPDKKELKATVPGKNTAPTGTSSKKRVAVISPDGKTGTVPENKLADAIKQGYKVR